jgi:hypothetical protein
MTRFIHDQFAKDYLETLLSTYGEVQTPRRVAAEVRQIDLYFTPSNPNNPEITTLGLLGELAKTVALFEPFRNPATPQEICDCLLKLLQVRSELLREANRNSRNLQESDSPKLWILTPTASAKVLSGFNATIKEDWLPGIYFLGEYLRTAIVVIHQLPRIPETIWLRILGRENVQKQAIDELELLPINNPYRETALILLNRLKADLQVKQAIEPEDRELIMRLSPLFDQQLQHAKEEGRLEGEQEGEQRAKREVVENFLRVRFGALDEELSGIIETFVGLSPDEFTSLLLQLSNLSREELLAHFTSKN